MLDKEQDIKNYIAKIKDYEKGIYKLPDGKFLSNEHNLIKDNEVKSGDEMLLPSYETAFELENLIHYSIDHYIAFKMNQEKYPEISQSQNPLNFIKAGTTFSELETSEYLKNALIAIV